MTKMNWGFAGAVLMLVGIFLVDAWSCRRADAEVREIVQASNEKRDDARSEVEKASEVQSRTAPRGVRIRMVAAKVTTTLTQEDLPPLEAVRDEALELAALAVAQDQDRIAYQAHMEAAIQRYEESLALKDAAIEQLEARPKLTLGRALALVGGGALLAVLLL